MPYFKASVLPTLCVVVWIAASFHPHLLQAQSRTGSDLLFKPSSSASPVILPQEPLPSAASLWFKPEGDIPAYWLTGAAVAEVMEQVSPAECRINACEAPSGWMDAINATVRISNGCTGVVVNNTNQDHKPYILTAYHCGSPSVGQTVNWTFYFNDQVDDCSNPQPPTSNDTMQGAVVRAAMGGYNDYVLLELLEPIPSEYDVHFAGWSIADAGSTAPGTRPTSGMVVGHPQRDLKKITVDDDPIDHYGSTHWLGQFDHGTVEVGSSGSPLFNQNHQVVGLVRAALQMKEECSGPDGDDNEAVVLFPKLSYNWNAGAGGERLSDFLDPAGTGSNNMPPLGPPPPASEPSPIWVNEINAHGGSPQDDEYIEIVGPPGTSLSNYQIDIYSCSNGTASLQSTQTINSFTLANDYQEFGIFLMGGSSGTLQNVDQLFSGSDNTLPDGNGILVLKDNGGEEIFDYQYDDAGNECPTGRTTRSVGDDAGQGTMGFTMNTNPSTDAQAAILPLGTPGTANSDGGQLLPVELTSFDAQLDGDTVLLLWETASETNNAGFEVQLLSDIASTWQVASWIDGHGTTELAQAYSYRHSGLLPGTYRFRLKQIDYDGTFEYSPEVEVAVGLPDAFRLSAAYPNPFNPETSFSVSVAQAQEVEIAVYSMLGRKVSVLHRGQMEAQHTQAFRFDASGLPSGTYMVRVMGERFVTSQAITLLK